MKEYKELELNRYVIATLDNPTQYLISEHFGKWSFTDNIQMASKMTNKNIANELKSYFYKDTKLNNEDMELLVLPLKIEYKLIDELG